MAAAGLKAGLTMGRNVAEPDLALPLPKGARCDYMACLITPAFAWR
jgi:hypothetical protein